MADRFRELSTDKFDVVVIGAGIGGLTAAAILARKGKRVLVVDGHYVAGGNATIFRRKDFRFDVGLHYIGSCHPSGLVPRMLRGAGVDDVEFEPMDPEGFDTLVYPDRTFRVPKGLDAYRERLAEAFPAERAGIDRYLALLREIGRFQDALGSPLGLAANWIRSPLLRRYARTPLSDFLDSCTRDPVLRGILVGQNGLYGQPPSRAATLVAGVLAFHYVETGGYTPRGGGQVLSDRLASAIEERGGKILLLTRARRVIIEGRRAVGVEIESKHLGRRVIRAPVIISNADYKQTLLELVGSEHLPPKLTASVTRATMSPAFGVLFLGMRRDLRAEGHPRTNYWISDRYDYESDYAAVFRGEIPNDPCTYVSLASVKDPSNAHLAPAGTTNLQVMAIVPSQPEAWGVTEAAVQDGSYQDSPAYLSQKDRLAELLLRRASKVLPGLEQELVYREVATPLTHRRYTRSTDGTSYGLALVPEQMLGGRPGSKTPIRGLLLAGASCRMGHGIPGSMASGVAAAAEVVGLRLFGEVFGPRNDGRSAPA